DPALQDESASIDLHGRFRLTTSAAGSFTLSFSGELGGTIASAEAEVRLAPGENFWEADVPTGALRGSLRLGVLERDAPLEFVSEAHPGLVFRVNLQADAGGSFGAGLLP